MQVFCDFGDQMSDTEIIVLIVLKCYADVVSAALVKKKLSY